MIKRTSDLYSYTHEGGRRSNEDVILTVAHDCEMLAVAADGMGGSVGGEMAARTAVESIRKKLENEKISTDLLYDAVVQANRDVRSCIDGQNPKTTIAVLWLDQEQAILATVGDTRIYQFRAGGIRFQTRDHTVAQFSIKAGKLEENKLRQSNERFKLINALGVDDEIKVDLHSLDIRSGDSFLICTDGFWELIDEQEMLDDLKRSKNAGNWLLNMKTRIKARITENSDNYSAIVLSLD